MLKVLIVAAAVPACVLAQGNPFSSNITGEYTLAKGVIIRAAQKMPEDNYNFRPTDDVRTFGQLVGHVADAQYTFCSTASGEKNPGLNIEKTKTTKADLVSALQDAFAYCDKIYSDMNDTTGAQTVKFFGRDLTRVGVLAFSNMHDYEHYGNMVTYMRLKGIVPPSSEQPAQRPPAKK